MNYDMTHPCDVCPFLIGSNFAWLRLREFSKGEFPCHKFCPQNEDGEFVARNDNTPHCAGALIFLEHRNEPHQMMRISERLDMYDFKKLDMDARVITTPSDCKRRKA